MSFVKIDKKFVVRTTLYKTRE